MTKRIILISLIFMFALGIGCRSAVVKNINNQPMTLNGTPSMQQVEKAIISAGAGLGWLIKSESPGNLTGTLALRTHVATVDIKHTKTDYSINYKDSKNLEYDGTNIHSNYNAWVDNLSKAINAQLAAL